ncbi:hypothetical protein [[Eubacterium] cellulosolvens]
MAGVLDFLFEGRPPSSVNTYGQSVKDIPKWLSDYTQGLVGRANMIAAEPYIPYEGPRISGFTPDQLQAFNMARGNVGSWSPLMQGAAEAAYAGGSADPYAAGAPFLQAGMQTFPGAVQDYMDPYIENVLNRQQELSQRNLEENLIPAMQGAFIGSGTFGGDRMAEIATRMARDTAEGLQGQQLGALSQAYGQAGNLFNQDMSRYLQGGIGLGQLEGMRGDLGLKGSQQLGALAEGLQGLGWRDVAGLESVGRQQQDLGQRSMDLAYQDFLQQRDYPRETINWMNSVIRGIPYGQMVTSQQTGPADVYGPSPLSQIASLYSTWQGLGAPGSQG